MNCRRIPGQDAECNNKSFFGTLCPLCRIFQDKRDTKKAYNATKQREYYRNNREKEANTRAENRRLNADSVQVDVAHGSAHVDHEVLRMAVRDMEQQRNLFAQVCANDRYCPKCTAQGCPNPCIRDFNCTDCPNCKKCTMYCEIKQKK